MLHKMTVPEFPPAFLIHFHVYFKNKCDPQKLYNELPINDVIVSLKPKRLCLDICLGLGLKFVAIRLFSSHINIMSCKNLDEAHAIINKFSEVSNVQFDIVEIKEAMVIHKYQIPLGGLTTHHSKIIKLKDSIGKNSYTSFRINGQNITQTSRNSSIAYESFCNFINKINNEDCDFV